MQQELKLVKTIFSLEKGLIVRESINYLILLCLPLSALGICCPLPQKSALVSISDSFPAAPSDSLA